MYKLPLILVKEFGTVHRHDDFGDMTQLRLVFGQRTYYITEPAGFGHRVTFCGYMNNFHGNEL
jgi:hypothetical protein